MSARSGSRVVVVGGGPSGLSAAIELRRRGVSDVIVFDREEQLGGIPRHTDHLGFGLRDLHRMTTGPRYARRLVTLARHHGVDLRASTTVLDFHDTSVVLATGESIAADAIVLATGVRERPRAARLVPGDRPAGVFTTGSIQQLTALHHRNIGRRGVIVGAEHVSFSAIWTMRHGGCRPIAMITPFERHQTVAPLRAVTAIRHRVPIITGVSVAEIVGRRRVEAVVLSDGRLLACDTVVFTGDWIPDHEIARRGGLSMTRSSGSPVITAAYQTTSPGVFAIGNLVHPAETADICSLDGRAAAAAVMDWLGDRMWPDGIVPIDVEGPIAWSSHSAHGVTVRVSTPVRGRVQLVAGDDVIASTRRRLLVPNRAITVRAELASVGPLTVRLQE